MTKPVKRKAFTLLELMVCLVLIGLLGALIGIKGVDLLAHHRFRSTMQTWLLDVGRAQILAMHQKCDVVCTLKKRQEVGYQVILESDSPTFSPTSYVWKDVEKITLQGKIVDTLAITFSPSGRISPVGIVQIVPRKEEKDTVFLDLSYPMVFHTNSIPFFSLSPPFSPHLERKSSALVDK
jgi:prepilin-type N-terminal cleavage/methylation domain-containing protein